MCLTKSPICPDRISLYIEMSEQKLGAYEIRGRLGQGGMGEVLLAWDKRLRREVAIKRVLAEKADTRGRARFLREARAVARLSHPSIVQIFDIFEQGDDDCIVMEFVEGQGLDDLTGGAPLEVERALSLARDVAEGLAEAHRKGLIHRDLKSANVRVAENTGRAKVLDFGLALALNEEEIHDPITQPGGIVGTPHAMSPEQVAGSVMDHRSDLFSLGAMLYEMLTNVAPFLVPGEVVETLSRVQRYQPVPLRDLRPEVSPAAEELINNLLRKNPNHRPGDSGRVARELSWLADQAAGTRQLNDEHLRLSFAEEVDAEVIGLPTIYDDETLNADGGIGEEPLFLLRAMPAATRIGEETFQGLLARFNGYRTVTRHEEESDAIVFEKAADAVGFALAYQEVLTLFGGTARIAALLGDIALQAQTETGFSACGSGRRIADLMLELAAPGQILLERRLFDAARRAAVAGPLADPQLRWLAHGTYALEDVEDNVEICQVGLESNPLEAPSGNAKVRRLEGEEQALGWRPAAGQAVPRRPDWDLLDRLGEGGFGEVWLAVHPTGERRVFKFCFDVSKVRALKREVTLLRFLRELLGHRPDIGRLLDWDFDNAPFFLEAEFSEGGNLEQWAATQGGIANVATAVRYRLAAEIADALAVAHSVGVLHKDVKPPNILVRFGDGQPHAVLVDFGIGTLADRGRLEKAAFTIHGFTEGETVTSKSSGTVGYIAPEVVEGKAATARSDIYALGVLIYQLACGDLGRIPAPGWQRDIDDEVLREDLASFMDRHPENRPESAHKVAEKLRNLDERRVNRRALLKAQQRREITMRLAVAAAVATTVVTIIAIVAIQGRNAAVFQKNIAENTSRAAVAANLLARGQSRNGNQVALEIERPETMLTGGATLREAIDKPVEMLILEHTDEVVDAAWSLSGTRILTASWDGKARIWNAEDGTILQSLQHGDKVSAAAWSPDGHLVVTASDDDTARIWNAIDGTEVAVLAGHEEDVTAISWEPDGKRVATIGQDGTVRVWNLETGGSEALTMPGRIRRFAQLAWSPAGGRVASTLGEKLRLWGMNRDGDWTQVAAGEAKAFGIGWSPDGEWLAVGNQDGIAEIRNASGEVNALLEGHLEWIAHVAWSPSGRRLVTTSTDRSARVWDVSGSLITTLTGHTDEVWRADWSADGERIATCANDNTARVWLAGNGRQLAVLAGHEGQVTRALWDPKGQSVLTVSADSTARIWRPRAAGKELMVFDGHLDSVRAPSWSPDEQRILTVSSDRTARIWEAVAGQTLTRLRGHEDILTHAAWSPDGNRVATTSNDRTTRLWESATGNETAVLSGHEDRVLRVAWSPDGQRLATGSWDTTLRTWDVDGSLLLRLPPEGGEGHEGAVHTVAWNANGTRILSSATDATARLWDASTGEQILVFRGHESTVRALWSPNESRVLTYSYDHTARVWNAADASMELVLDGHTDGIWAADWSPDGTRIATGSRDLSVRVWDAGMGTTLAVLPDQPTNVRSVAWSDDGRYLAAAATDGTITIWEPATGIVKTTLLGHGFGLYSKPQWSSDGQRLLTASNDNTARIWALTENTTDYLRGRIRARIDDCPTSTFHTEILNLTVTDAEKRSKACETCLPQFFAGLGDTPGPQAYEDAWRVYEACFNDELK